MTARPTVNIQRSYTRRVELNLSEEDVSRIIQEWLIKNVPQFRGTHIEVNIDCGPYEGSSFSCTAIGIKHKEENR